MARFFVPSENITEEYVTINGRDQHHLLNVLRKKEGDRLTVLDGKGEELLVEITEIFADFLKAKIVEKVERTVEPSVKITLIQGLPKADKFEWIIQKNTELGVCGFIPVQTLRSTVKLDKEARRKKGERWEKIICSAAQQSGRAVIPELKAVKDWRELLNDLPEGLTLIPWEAETGNDLKTILQAQKEVPEKVNIIIGPEGGFSYEEVKEAEAAGAIPVSLGPRILRTETAGLVAATAVFYHFGDLS